MYTQNKFIKLYKKSSTKFNTGYKYFRFLNHIQQYCIVLNNDIVL